MRRLDVVGLMRPAAGERYNVIQCRTEIGRNARGPIDRLTADPAAPFVTLEDPGSVDSLHEGVPLPHSATLPIVGSRAARRAMRREAARMPRVYDERAAAAEAD